MKMKAVTWGSSFNSICAPNHGSCLACATRSSGADGTTYYGDELATGGAAPGGTPGGAIYKFVPTFPLTDTSPITDPAMSPFAGGKVYGLRVGIAGNNGQGAEIGKGRWIAIDAANPAFLSNGNLALRAAQSASRFTGSYRPEDMDLDPIAFKHGDVRMCWSNTGRVSNGGGSDVETDAIYGEVMCLNDDDSADPAIVTGAIPLVTRFMAGHPQAEMFDNVAFQPHTGNLVVLEDGEVEVAKEGATELRGNDIWMCLPDGDDDDVQTDGCIRIASLKDTSSEPTGFIFTGSGETAFVSIQHRSTQVGALMKITGFNVEPHRCGLDRDDDFFHWHRRNR